MAKLVKFPLEMADGTKARSLEDLREHADVASIAACYENGKLRRWLLANYLEDEAEKISAVQEIIKSESDKINTLKIQNIYNALGIQKIDEAQLAEYLANKTVIDESKTSEDFEIEDDTTLKAEVKKYLMPGTNLDNWNIASEESDDENLVTVHLAQKVTGEYSCINLKKDGDFYERIANVLMSLDYNYLKAKEAKRNLIKKINAFGASDDDSDDYSEDYSAASAFFDSPYAKIKAEPVQFGKYKWYVIKRGYKHAFLVCTRRVKNTNANDTDFAYYASDLRKWLNSDFFNDSFDSIEASMLLKHPNGDKISLISEELVKKFSASERKNLVPNSWLLGDDRKVISAYIDDNGGMNTGITFGYGKQNRGVVPAIIVSLEDS